ncbi:MAG: polysaccharide pyruvyl transferase CsaB [Firmicutes bacterium]|nr:polysaccharide pyruvyl transferase CsaB [Bacillota bacterium]
MALNMKILMIVMGLEIGGAETHVTELSKELSRRGNEVVVVSSGGVYVPELTDADIRHVCLPTDKRSVGKMFRAYIGLYKLIKHEKFDIVHAHARIPAFLCSIIRKSVKFNFITTAHWVFKTGPLLNVLTNWGERTIAVSDDIKEYLKDNYSVPENHITVTINGIDTEKFAPDNKSTVVIDEFGLNPTAPKAVYVSRIDTDRSAVAFLLVEAMPQICEKHPNLELVIVGGGNDYNRLERKVQKANEKLGRKGIILAGPRIDINNFISCADVFIGVSRAALEAMSAAKPVIIAGNEGNIGLFDSGKLAVGVETNFCCRGCEMPTVSGLYKDVVSVLDKTPAQREEMGNYNRSIIIDMYSVKKMADDCEDAYADLLSIDRVRPYDIMISGYYGYKNTGDDSLLYAIINNLTSEKPKVDITVLSAKPTETGAAYGVRSMHRFNLLKVLRYMRRTKLLISGGGSLLQDVTSTKSLIYYLAVINMAKNAGMKAMVYASGIGPIRGKKNKIRTAKVLNKVDLITLREPESFEELKLLGANHPAITITTDPAFSLRAENDALVDNVFKSEKLDNGKGYFAVCIRQWKEADNGFNTKLAEVCDYINGKYGLTPLFISMQSGTDYNASCNVAKYIKSGYEIIKDCYTAPELIGVISRCKLVIGMRLHSLIYSAVAGVPLFGISYDTKVDSMLLYLGQNHKENVKSIDVSKMKTKIDELMAHHGEISDDIKQTADKMRRKTRTDARCAIKLLDEKIKLSDNS